MKACEAPLLVIDGQQRLTTVTLLLATLAGVPGLGRWGNGDVGNGGVD